jgi:demethylmenaquinone methyltransferase/2-methoxy-6-polyprenyl-1,4-benzoquinol methylase
MFEHDEIVPSPASAKPKKQQVAEMFDDISGRYDFMNRFLSGGTDVYWRKAAIKELTTLQPQRILDIATGTGDLAIMAAEHFPGSRITGIDISTGMLERGRKKIANLLLNKQIELLEGDSEAINAQDGTFDAITVAFGVRNFANLEKGIHEMHRVLKPGGKVVILEFSKPCQRIFRGLYNFYMRFIAPGIASWVTRNKEAYQYLHNSVKAFPEGEAFLHVLRQSGFKDISLKRLSLGICTIYCGTKTSGQRH